MRASDLEEGERGRGNVYVDMGVEGRDVEREGIVDMGSPTMMPLSAFIVSRGL